MQHGSGMLQGQSAAGRTNPPAAPAAHSDPRRPPSALDRASEAEGALVANIPSTSVARQSLPVFRHRTALLYLVEQHGVVVVVGQTGSGKTTQIPQFLAESGWAAEGRVIACTQPRRVAATSLAARVAHESGTRLGDEVGYAVRFEDCTHESRTRIKFATSGLLFRECLRDPLLSAYSVVMVDEAHERDAYTDLLLALLKKIRKQRPDLRVIISSATLDAESYAAYFGGAAILSIEGRTHPVSLAYTGAPAQDYVAAAVDAAWHMHNNAPAGDMLIFLTGRDEIDAALQMIADRAIGHASPPQLLALHANVDAATLAAVFAPAPTGTRKIVAATNVAEASVTIDGIRYVIDCGYTKLRQYDHVRDMDVLAVVPASQAASAQRAGRAGRTAPGHCIRLYPETAARAVPQSTAPELVRCDVAPFVLQLLALGVTNIARFDFVPPAPSAHMLAGALEYLAALQAIDDKGCLTLLGERLAEAPLDPMLARALLAAVDEGCADEMLTIAAMTTVATPFIQSKGAAGVAAEISRRKFVATEGDHLTLLNVYRAFVDPKIGKQSPQWAQKYSLSYAALRRAMSIRTQLEKYLVRRWRLPVTSSDDATKIRRCLVAGFFRHAARALPDGSYVSARGGATLHAHPSSVFSSRRPESGWVVYHEVLHTAKSYMRDVCAIEQDWLVEMAPHYYEVTKK
ncbi:RNA helicase [Malassezia cuniculi]|uniref:RNA helicase n=1 Tax=Malassezia cuniculi TaxID=948313 RepID=A0AAF0J699_9BASI|nr:RNA helicase [Malassezia cuniculi]